MRIKFADNFKLFRIIKVKKKKNCRDVQKDVKILTYVIKWQMKFSVD